MLPRIRSSVKWLCHIQGRPIGRRLAWTVEDLKPYADVVLEAFGPERVMWGSDWPVSRLRGEYGDWHGAAQKLCAHLPEVDRAAIFGGTGMRFYRLK